jgi:hypothetical protein
MPDRNIAALFAALDTEKLFVIAMRIVSNDTVEDVHQFAALVKPGRVGTLPALLLSAMGGFEVNVST